jgi:hypothetical protein
VLFNKSSINTGYDNNGKTIVNSALANAKMPAWLSQRLPGIGQPQKQPEDLLPLAIV